MQLMNLINTFKNDEDGAVTVDWVVLTAAVVGLGLIVMGSIRGSITDLSSGISEQINKAGEFE